MAGNPSGSTDGKASTTISSSQALCNATLPYVRELASLGIDGFAGVDAGHGVAINIRNKRIVNIAVSEVYPDLPNKQ